MIILLDTASPTCYLTIVDGDTTTAYQWEAGRTLAHGLLDFLVQKLAEHDKTIDDISGIGVMQGPGSFTGLRIGLTVMNTIASDRHLPIVGVVMSDDWRDQARVRLDRGENDQLVMPVYGSDAHITAPRR